MMWRKYLANEITVLRIIFAIIMVVSVPFSIVFWISYVCAGLSDFLDGYIARRLNQQSESGARLDSVADGIFAICIAVIVVINVRMPVWLLSCILGIAILRFIGYGIGFYKYHTFSSLHTYANKATGFLIFAFPLLYRLMGINITGVILCSIALLSSIEELTITIESKKLNRDRKSWFIRIGNENIKLNK
jgi:CDP-diacylglycerol--glycerol-3-phosphate 3-phosphatidyltransferase